MSIDPDDAGWTLADRRRRLAWNKLPIGVPDLMPNRGDYQLLDVFSRDAGYAACLVLAVLQHSL